jgi:hypothetical protein
MRALPGGEERGHGASGGGGDVADGEAGSWGEAVRGGCNGDERVGLKRRAGKGSGSRGAWMPTRRTKCAMDVPLLRTAAERTHSRKFIRPRQESRASALGMSLNWPRYRPASETFRSVQTPLRGG